MSSHPQPDPGNDPNSSQEHPPRPLYLVRHVAADPDTGEARPPASEARGTASAGAENRRFVPPVRDGERSDQRPTGMQRVPGTERGQDRGEHNGPEQLPARRGYRQRPTHSGTASAFPSEYSVLASQAAVAASASTQTAAGHPTPAEQVQETEELPSMQTVGMPWPRHPYELRPPSPDLVGAVPRRPDCELDPGSGPGWLTCGGRWFAACPTSRRTMRRRHGSFATASR
ncbi:hypothetical protein GCM10027610_023180 [Dactylosporangium cerinum]